MRKFPALFGIAAFVAGVLFGSENAGPPSAETVLAGFKLDPGLKIELVACEPQIQSPAAITFDEHGRLFVVEMLDYPNPVQGQPPAGRIRMLTDTNGDGVYKVAPTVFADKLLMANGAAPWRGGLLVTCAPHLLYLKDTDNDGIADRRDLLFDGFATQNPQLRASHPTLGIDNWFYVTNGQRTADVHNLTGGPKLELTGLDFRFNPLDLRYEAVTGVAQFGLAFDDWGRRFDCTNRNHLIEIVMENRYFARNSYLVAPPPKRDDQRPGGAARVYPISGNKTLAASHAGTFTAACGVYVYRGGALPKEYEGSVFTCEPTANLIHREILSQNGASFSNRSAQDGVEFLASPSPWFRPVNITTGPDGALYVIDFCRAEVEHPDWVPASLRHRYDFNGRRDTGRIWKITAKDYHAPPRVDWSTAGIQLLTDKLGSENAWERATAQRMVLENWKPAWVEALEKKAGDAQNPRAQVLALWLLHSQNALRPEIVAAALSAAHPGVRENALQVAERFAVESPGVLNALIPLAHDSDPRVRFQAACSLGAWSSDDRILEPLAVIAAQDGADRWTRLAVASAVPESAGKLLKLCMDRCNHGDLFAELAAVAGARKNAEEIVGLIAELEKQPLDKSSAALDGLSTGIKRRGSSLKSFLGASKNEESKAALERLLEVSVTMSLDEKQPAPVRERAINLAAQLPEEKALAALRPLLNTATAENIRTAAIQSIGSFDSREAAQVLLALWKSGVPATRQQLLQALTSKPEQAKALLDRVEEGKITASELGGTAQRQLSSHRDKSISERAKKMLNLGVSPDRASVIERYRPALAKGGDLARGKDVFAKNCVACHRINNVGNVVGPDISDMFSREPEALLVDILDPSRAIDTNYVTYAIRTKAGLASTGLIAAKSASSVTLRRDNAQEETFLLEDVASLQSTGKSLMPDGLESAITPEAMADLIAYLKNWRDLAGK